jgi:excinuclease ABC subunit B
MKFKLVSPYQPTGDQPGAIEALLKGLEGGLREQTLLGVTGSGKTFVMSNLIAGRNAPTLVLAHNKTLAAQLYSEFREFFPENEVHYFVSYFDYYQPEAYIASTDTYIEKDSAINEEIDRLRHAATEALLTRRDTIIVASVSCIYGIGSPKKYLGMALRVKTPDSDSSEDTLRARLSSQGAGAGVRLEVDDQRSSLPQLPQNPNSGVLTQKQLVRQLLLIQYHRNDVAFERGNFRVKGDTVDVFPASGTRGYRLEFGFEGLERIKVIDPLTAEVLAEPGEIGIFPNTHYATPSKDQSPLSAPAPQTQTPADKPCHPKPETNQQYRPSP